MLRDTIQTAIHSALKEKRETDLKVLRFILSEIKYKEIDKHANLSDEEIVSLIQKEIKKRKEAIELFKKGGRNDLVIDEEKQLIILEHYTPKQMSEEQISTIVDEVLAQFAEHQNMGKIIGGVISRVKGRADGAIVSRIVKEKMSSF